MNDTYYTSAHAPPEPHLPLGWRLMAYPSLDSTNSALRRLVEQGAELSEGVLVWAKEQTGGRGRQGRAWASAPGNVYASYLIAAPNPAEAPQIGLLAARAIVDAILDLPRHNTAPPKVSCKWPNDVLVEGAKACGILPELTRGADGAQWVVLGIGVNLFPVDVAAPAYPVTSLIDHHIDTKADHALTVISRMLSSWLGVWREKGFEAIREAWLEVGPELGNPVSVNSGSGPVSGTFAGLDHDGALLLETPGGRHRIVAGDVLFGG